MPYLQVDLDAMHRWPLVAAGCGIPEEKVYRGFLKLWEACWRAKSGYVSMLLLECLFDTPGQGERTARVLMEFGFLEKRDLGLWVCGTEKYLRVAEARSKGGKKAAANGNLRRGSSKKRRNVPAEAGEQLEASSAQPPAAAQLLHQSPKHHSPSSKEDLPPPAAAEEPGRFQRLKLLLVAQIEAATKSKYGWLPGDPAALKRLMGFTSDDAEIQRRLGNGLKAAGYPHTPTICQLASKWNEPEVRVGDAPKRAAGGRFFAAQDADKTSLAKVGVIHDF